MKYKSLKEMPGVPAGTLFEQKPNGYYKADWTDSKGRWHVNMYFDDEIENNPYWFAPIDERWKPKLSERFWYMEGVLGSLNIDFDIWSDSNHDTGAYAIGNCFMTAEQAEAAVEKVKTLLLSLHKDN